MKKVLIAVASIACMTLNIETYAIGFGGAGRALGGSIPRSVSHSAPPPAPRSGVHTSDSASKAESHSTSGDEAGKETQHNSKIIPVPKNYNSQHCREDDQSTERKKCN